MEDKKMSEVHGLPSRWDTYKLYRRGTDGTPTLFMPDQTTIGSSLGNVDLSTDLASLASKEYVADEVDKFSRSNLAGRVDSYDKLPVIPTESSLYTPPALTSNGVPYVDDYAVDGDDLYSDAYMPYLASSDSLSGYWHTGVTMAFPKSYYMYFKDAIRLTSIRMRNRSDRPDCSFYGYTVEGSNDNGTTWDVVYSGVNTNNALTAYWTIDLSSNSKYYNTYRIKGTSSHFSNYLAQWLIQPSGYHIQYDASIHSRIGDIYLVGTEGNLEEYIFTDSYKWERLGEIRQSDVDLSGYTSTEGMMSLIDASSDHIGTNIEAMRTDIQEYLDTLEQGINGSIGELPLDCQFNTGIPAIWDASISDNGVLFVIEPDTIPYTSPELRTGNGTPFVDEYAVSASTSASIYPPYYATYTTDYWANVWYCGENALPAYFYMTYRMPMAANELYLKNRPSRPEGDHIYAPKDISLEAKDTQGNWVVLFTGVNPNSGGSQEITFPIDNTVMYNEYRLRISTNYPGVTNSAHACVDIVRLSGNIEKV